LVKGFHIVHPHTPTLNPSIKLIILNRNQSKEEITCAPASELYFLLLFLVYLQKTKPDLFRVIHKGNQM